MRYLIDTPPEHAGTVGSLFAKLEREGKIVIIQRGDPIEAIKADILKIQKAFANLQRSGISQDIMIGYIRSKGVPVSTIDNVLHHQTEFFRKLGLEV